MQRQKGNGVGKVVEGDWAVDDDFAVNSGDGSDVVSVHRECGIELEFGVLMKMGLMD